METTAGISAGQLAASSAEDATAGFGWRPSWRVAGGNQQLAVGLARRLGPAVRLGSPVRFLRQDQHGVHLATADGIVTGDAAVITVPMAVLRQLPITPPVPGRQRSAWERSGIAHKQALSALSVADGPATWAAQAAALRPELDADPARAILTTWNDDPWAGQSYSAGTVTTAPGDPALLAAPSGRIHFAGEHTAGHWAGLMEGALRSGQRAAAEVLAAAPSATTS